MVIVEKFPETLMHTEGTPCLKATGELSTDLL